MVEDAKVNKYPGVIVKKVNLEENDGYGGGIIAGLNAAKGNFIGWTHADLQTPLIDFYKLYSLIKEEKIVLGKGYRINNRGFDSIVSRLHEICASLILGFKMREKLGKIDLCFLQMMGN